MEELFSHPRANVETALPALVAHEWRTLCDEYDARRRTESQALFGHPGAHIGTIPTPSLEAAVLSAIQKFETATRTVNERLTADEKYDHDNDSKFSLAECDSVVGSRATLTLTGRIVEADVSCRGPFVRFQPDDRFGFGGFRFGIDLDALTVQEDVA